MYRPVNEIRFIITPGGIAVQQKQYRRAAPAVRKAGQPRAESSPMRTVKNNMDRLRKEVEKALLVGLADGAIQSGVTQNDIAGYLTDEGVLVGELFFDKQGRPLKKGVLKMKMDAYAGMIRKFVRMPEFMLVFESAHGVYSRMPPKAGERTENYLERVREFMTCQHLQTD